MKDYFEVLTECYLDFQKGSEGARKAIEQACEMLGMDFDSMCELLDDFFNQTIDKEIQEQYNKSEKRGRKVWKELQKFLEQLLGYW